MLSLLNERAEEFSLDPLKKKAWEKFNILGLPSRDQEMFSYMTSQDLYSSYQIPKTTSCFSIENLPKEAVCLPFNEALVSPYGALLKKRVSSWLDLEDVSFLFLNYALLTDAYFIYLPPHLKIDGEIKISFHYQGGEVFFPKLYVYIGQSTSARFSFSHRETGASLVMSGIEMHLEKGSHCYVENEKTQLPQSTYFNDISFFLKRDAKAFYAGADLGSKTMYQSVRASLTEENAEVTLKGISLLEENKRTHHHVQVKHLAPHTTSHQYFKSILFDNSKCSFEGKIDVDPIAQKTEAYQLSHHLLLSPHAAGYSKPSLRIFADDVKASHGATIAQLNEEDIFYLQARGLNPILARKLLIKGFCLDILKELDESIQQLLLTGINKRC